MRGAVLAAFAAALTASAPAFAQTPRAVSRHLARALDRDTSVTAWVIAQPGADLTRLADSIRARGGRVRFTSRFVNAVSAEISGRALRELAALRDVRHIQPVVVYVRLDEGRLGGQAARRLEEARPPDQAAQPPSRLAAAPEDTLYGLSWPYRQLDIPPLHDRGLRGAGVRIALLDAGFNTQHPFLTGATVIAQRDFVHNDSVVRDQPGEVQGEMAHGTQVWSLLAANAPGRLFGVAPGASYLLAKTEFTPTETRVEEDRWVAAVEWADSIGVDIISSSLGYLTFDGGTGYTPAQLTGDFAVTTIAADSAAARGILVVVAAGNEGPAPRTLGTPADGDSVIAVGATDSLARVPTFSSRGPTADNRIKPDVVAPGSFVPVARVDTGVTVGSGSSFSAPLVAGIAALVQGTRPGRPAVELLRGLVDAGGTRHTADNTQGFGIVSALRLYAFPTGFRALGPPPGALGTLSPSFSWDAGTPPAGAGPTTYRLRIARDSQLATLLLDTTVAATAFTLPFAPPPNIRLFWRAIAASQLGVVESTAVNGPLTVPPWVALLTLAQPQGHSIRDTLPTFIWRPADVLSPPGPFVYDVYVYPSARGPSAAVEVARGLSDTTFVPTRPLERNLPFRWRVVAHLGADSVAVTSPGTFIVLDETAPTATVLFQNFPNPFPNTALGVRETCFWFDVAAPGEVRLEVFDVRGRLIRRLAPSGTVSGTLPPGRYGRPPAGAVGTCDPRFQWDGRDERGDFVRPGVYIYRLTAPGFRESRRVVFRGG